MRYPQCLVAALCIGALSQAFADDPPSPAQAPTATAAPVQSPIAAAAPATAVDKTDSTADSGAQAQAKADAKAKAIDKRLRAQGYKPVNDNGTLRYCKSEQALGSRFEKSVCGTPGELDFAEQNGKETVQRIQQMNSSLPAGK